MSKGGGERSVPPVEAGDGAQPPGAGLRRGAGKRQDRAERLRGVRAQRGGAARETRRTPVAMHPQSGRGAEEGPPGLLRVGRNTLLYGLAGRQNLRRPRLPRVGQTTHDKKRLFRHKSPRRRELGDLTWRRCTASNRAWRLASSRQRPQGVQLSTPRPLPDLGWARRPRAPQAQVSKRSWGADLRQRLQFSPGDLAARWEGDQGPSQGDPESAGARA